MEVTNTAPAENANTESPVVETAVEETKPRIDFSSKFAALARKEKALLEQKKAMESEINDINEWKRAKEEAKRNPNKFLKAHGLDFETVAKFNLEGGEERTPSEIETLKEKLEKIEKETEAQRVAREEQEKQILERNYNEQINNFKKQIESHVTSSTDKYEFINANPDHLNDVFELIELHFSNTQKILDIEQACQLVEDHIENEFKSKYAKINKLKGLLSQEEAPRSKQDYVPRQQQDIRNPSRPASLTNNITPQANYGKGLDQMSFEERRRHAASLLKFK